MQFIQFTSPPSSVRERQNVRSAAGCVDGAPAIHLAHDQPIAMGYVPTALAALGTRINAIVRGKPVPMEVVAMPFVPTNYFRG